MHCCAKAIGGVCVIFFLTIFVTYPACAQNQEVAGQRITITFRQDSLSTALGKLQQAISGDFAYDPAIIPRNKLITGAYTHVSLSAILEQVLFGTGLTYNIVGGAVVLCKKKPVSYTIDGHVTDASSGEELIGASIYLPTLRTSAISNQYGFYSLTVPEGDYEVIATSLGFARSVKTVHLNSNRSINHALNPRSMNLNEVEVETLQNPDNWHGERNLPTELLNRLPYYAGEVDVVKALQMQNGVKAMTEGGAGLFVRGGNADQNLITLDEAMVYNPSHLFGLVSVFNNDAIKQIQLYNDYIPANYGGRLSSVLDIRMADGNNREFHVKGGVSLLTAHLAVEGPLKKETGSFLLTARRSLIDLLHQNFRALNSSSSYYDLNAKANYQLNSRNKLYYSLYFGDDHLISKNSYNNKWGNVTSTFRWNHELNSRIFFNLSAVYSNYNNLLDVNADTLSEKYHWKTGIEDFSLKGDFTFFKSPGSEIKFGALGTYHNFIPGKVTDAFPEYYNIPGDISYESAVYFSHRWALSDKIQLNYGLRAGSFHNGEERRDVFDSDGNQIEAREHSTYYGLEPRLYLSYLLPNGNRLHATYNRCLQYLQLVQNSELTYSSLETWIPASASTRPQRSDYWSLGYDHSARRYTASFSLYYKKLANQPDLLNHSQVIRNPAIRNMLTSGISKGFGAELSLYVQMDKLALDAGYSYSRVYKTISGINNGERFRANYDVPHEFKTNQSWTPVQQLTLSTSFTISSGRVATLPVGYFVQDGINVPLFEGRNRSRFPVSHRLDFEARLLLSRNKEKDESGYRHVVSAGVYNVYNRKNPLFYRIAQTPDEYNDPFVSSAGILPWVAYSFAF
jgi:hypothetical protein